MKISDQPPLQIYKTESTAVGKPAQKQEGDELLLAPGQLVKGRVVGLAGDGKFLLDVGGQMVTARSLVPLTPGSELWLETGKGGSVPLLTLAAKKGGGAGFPEAAYCRRPNARRRRQGAGRSGLFPGR